MTVDETPDDALDRSGLRRIGRRALGLGTETPPEPLDRSTLTTVAYAGTVSGLAWALVVLLVVAGASISVTTGLTDGGLAAARVAFLGVAALGALLAAGRVATEGPARMLGAGATLTALALLAGSFAAGLGGLSLAAALTGLGAAAAGAAALPLVADVAGVSGRMRGMALHRAVSVGVLALVALVARVATVDLDLTWRPVFALTGLVAVVATVAVTRRVHDDEDRAAVDLDVALAEALDHADALDLGADEEVSLPDRLRRVLLVGGVTRILALQAVVAVFVLPLLLLVDRFALEYWNLGRPQGALVAILVLTLPVGGLVWFGRQGEAVWLASPGVLVERVGTVMALGGVAVIVAAFAPVLAVSLTALGVAVACAAIAGATLDTALMTVVARPYRPAAAALATTWAAFVGGIVVLGVADAITGRAGSAWGMGFFGLVAVLSRGSFRRLAVEVEAGIDNQIDIAAEEVRVSLVRTSGGHVPLLAARGIDFSYGPVQVLFDVDFTVDAGEMVALLGTNGAGKSTLLRVISGLGLPQSGSVRYLGRDITQLEAPKRVGLGITQVPGGKAAFGSMSVLENLRLNAYTLGADPQRLHTALDRCFEVFPMLDERRHQAASTLSGGQRQMLALSKALMLDPQLLLIDELSLGLAPVVVADLLDRVRTINEQGTAVVLVEQSVNVALSLVDHAYFMEKGEVRFDGPASELTDRPDIVRSVFLEGAAKGLGR